MNKQTAKRILVSQAVTLAWVCTSASAKETTDFSALYKSKSYDEICQQFEADKVKNWRNPNSAYFYALGLLGRGKIDAALNVCKSIQRQYPKTNAAKLAGSAVSLWSKRSAPKSGSENFGATSKVRIDEHIGIVGLKFFIEQGPPTINKVFPSTPAHQAGIRGGDIIADINGISTAGLTKEEIFKLIVGPPNSVVRMTIVRDGISTEKQMKRMLLDKLKEIDPDVYRDYIMSI